MTRPATGRFRGMTDAAFGEVVPSITLDGAMELLGHARFVALKLRAEKSEHPWTDAECELLAELCETLGLDP